MAEYSKKLHYIRDGITYDIKLYDSSSDIINTFPEISLYDNNKVLYVGTTDQLDNPEASHLRLLYNNKTYAITKQ